MRMRRCAWLVILVMLMTSLCVPVMAADEVVTANSTGYNDVPFSNGYNGFCLDKWLDIAYKEDGFVVGEASEATNNGSGESIAQYLKILFVDFFDTVFEKVDGEYKVKNATMTQATIYGFSDSASKDWDYEPLASVVAKYNEGRRVKDHGETIVVGDDKITFDFIVLKSQKVGQQDFFAYKLSVEKNVHEHKPSEPNCVTPSNCTECGEELSGVDPDTHTGNTELKDAVDAEDHKPGYTGDTYCKDCKVLLKKGTVIPALLPDVTPSPEPTATPAPTKTPEATATPKVTATLVATATSVATPTPTSVPTEEPTPAPTPTAEPTEEPTPAPTPTAEPTEEPTPTPTPAAEPTETPTATPSAEPTVEVTPAVTAESIETAVPDTTTAPAVTNGLDVTETPDATSKPDVTRSPEFSLNPNSTPGADVTPNAITTPNADSTPKPNRIPDKPVEDTDGGDDSETNGCNPPQTGDKGYVDWLIVMIISAVCLCVVIHKCRVTE